MAKPTRGSTTPFKGGRIRIKAKIAINDKIRAKRVRLVDQDGRQRGVVSREEALEIAREQGLDLVEVAPEAHPSVCKILDYGKFKYQQEKRRKKSRKKQSTNILKEVRLSYRIGEHDFEVKLRRICKFLKEGHRVKISLRFRGREMIYRDRGEMILKRITEEVQDFSKVESPPSASGRSIEQYLIPKPAK